VNAEPRVRTEVRDHVLLIAMSRPEKRNAIDQQMADELSAAFDMFDAEPVFRAAVLTGTSQVFSAGTDMKEPRSPTTSNGGEYGLVRRERRKPVIAAVEGVAFGGGFELVLACDLVVASATALFGLPEVKRGLVAACGALFRGPRALPRPMAVRLLLTGDTIDADAALRYGMLDAVSEPGRAVTDAVTIAARIAANSPAAVSATLRAIHAATAELDNQGWLATDRSVAEGGTSPDHNEGISAFFEKRTPRWSPLP
jgi:enoyl-CoA hydratase